jgi:hypothetical protein
VTTPYCRDANDPTQSLNRNIRTVLSHFQHRPGAF